MDKQCQRCKGQRILGIRARAKDQHDYTFLGKEYDGQYAMDFSEDGDTTSLEVCMDCGQTQGQFPMESVLES